MLIMVYDPDTELGATSQIVKFCDRIWFRDNGDAQCLRSLILHVSDDSTRSVSELCFLTPVVAHDIITPGVVDKSDTCPEPNYAFNNFKTGGYKVVSADEAGGIIQNDGFDNVTFRYHNRAQVTQIGNASLITLQLSQPIGPGEFREVRFLFAIKSLAQKYGGEMYAIDLPYFGEFTSFESYTGAAKALRSHRQVPAIPIRDPITKDGGFDVIMYLPPGTTGSDFAAHGLKSIDSHDADGLQSEGREKYIWRLRQATDAPAVVLGADFSIVGSWSRGIQPRISDVDKMVSVVARRVERLSTAHKRTDVIAIVGLAIAVLTLILFLALR